MEAREHATGLRFDVVASVRVDTIFTREVPAPVFAFASKMRSSPSAWPRSSCPTMVLSINGDLVLNDRFALGQRQEMLYTYLNRIETLITYHVNKSETRHVGISGERHLLNAVSDKHIPVARLFEFCLTTGPRGRAHLVQALRVPGRPGNQIQSMSGLISVMLAVRPRRAV